MDKLLQFVYWHERHLNLSGLSAMTQIRLVRMAIHNSQLKAFCPLGGFSLSGSAV